MTSSDAPSRKRASRGVRTTKRKAELTEVKAGRVVDPTAPSPAKRKGVAFAPHIEFRPGAYAPGRKTVTQILEAALDILINEGSHELTLRRIATVCNLRIGNVTYHFATKNDLIRAVLDVVSAAYSEALHSLKFDAEIPAELRLEQLISFILKDIETKTTTNLFIELWALANHDPFVAECINDIYRRGRELFMDLIREINPELDAVGQEVVATFIQACTEGMTIFAGYKKPQARRMALIEAVSVKVLVDFVRNIDPKTIRPRLAKTT